MKTISFKVDDDLFEKLDKQASKLKLSRSVIIRAATEAYLKKISKMKTLMDFLENVPEIEASIDEIKAVKEYEKEAKNETKSFSLEEAKKELNLQ